MKYMGGKSRHARDILKHVLAHRDNRVYVEPFVGGANVIQHVTGSRIAADAHTYLIAMYQALQQGWRPPVVVSEAEYAYCKAHPDENPPLTAFVGFACSYAAKWFGGYARGNDVKGNPRCFSAEQARAVTFQALLLQDVEFCCCHYDELMIPASAVIYCDPPYASTTTYATGKFDSEKFWRWCELQVESGHQVFVSEYTAPPAWDCVWEKAVSSSLTKNTGSQKATERLFTR